MDEIAAQRAGVGDRDAFTAELQHRVEEQLRAAARRDGTRPPAHPSGGPCSIAAADALTPDPGFRRRARRSDDSVRRYG
jgi:hypothetical protein